MTMFQTPGYRRYQHNLLRQPVVELLYKSQQALTLWINSEHSQETSEEMQDLLTELTKCLKPFHTGRTCPRCGMPLYLSDLPQYDGVCYECNENF